MDGTRIGTYVIERKLGEGGMGVVYVAVDTRLGRRAAVKQLLPELSGNREIVERFFNEAKAAASIDHPGIVEIYDVGWHSDGSAYFAMKLLEGDSLARRLRATGPMPVQLAATIARQVASAVAAAHARGIVHRDLKPDNIVLVADDEVAIGERAKVLDFGIAKLFGEQAVSQTRTGSVMGTPAYMSPEQCRGAGEVDHRTDVYALGCILFEMLAGRPPFVGAGVGEVLGMHQFVEPPTLRALRPDASAELEAVVMGALAKQPEQRIPAMSALAVALQPFAAQGARSMERAAQSGAAVVVAVAGGVAPTVPPTLPVGVQIPQVTPVSAGGHAGVSGASAAGASAAGASAAGASAAGASAAGASAAGAGAAQVVPSTLATARGELSAPSAASEPQARKRRTWPLIAGGGAAIAGAVAVALAVSGGRTEVGAGSTAPVALEDAAGSASAGSAIAGESAGAAPDSRLAVVPVAPVVPADAGGPEDAAEVAIAPPEGPGSAAEPAVTPPTSRPAASRAQLTAQLSAALAARKWAAAKTAADALGKLEPGSAVAKRGAEQAANEAAAQRSYERLLEAARKRDWSAASRAWVLVPFSSVYAEPTKVAFEQVRTDHAAEMKKQAQAMAAGGDCEGIKRLLAGVSGGFSPSRAAIESVACTPGKVTLPSISAAIAANAATKPIPELVTEARTAAQGGHYRLSLQLSEAGLAREPANIDLLGFAVVSACNLKLADKARLYLPKLPEARRTLLRQICLRQNIDVGGSAE